MSSWKTVLLCTLLVMVAAPIFGQAPDKSPQVVFRFVEGNDMFYVPWNGNGTALDSLCRMIVPANPDRGSIRVDGYSRTKKLSMIRCNRVKSELITRKGLKEEHFTTTNNVGKVNGQGNVVFVTLPILYKVGAKQQVVPSESKEMNSTDKTAFRDKAETKQPETATLLPAETEQASVVTSTDKTDTVETVASRNDNPDTYADNDEYAKLTLRANLLRWATLTPDLGIEWRINKNWSLQLNGTWTAWSWDNKNRRYALWEVSPEIRYHIGQEKRGYVGAMYHVGKFNYKLNDTGKQGDLMGGGITGGYLLRLNRVLSLDFSLGIGCTHAEYDNYTVIDGVRVKQGKTDKNYWGVNHAGISLLWTIF